ncbi:hypothetical protein [Xanthomonas bromi]|uniref:hypothetical protein n=1 Tax=Xanthomonas bromi TaxID=56449 RepID=UPI0021587315|nr:hypothetical protein [Xanthomonas bromi]
MNTKSRFMSFGWITSQKLGVLVIRQVSQLEVIGGGGGKFSCGCKVTPGKVVNLYWTFEQTRQEYDSGVKPEEHTIRVQTPQPQSSSSRYFRIFFRKNGTASLQWVDDMGADELPPTPSIDK